jgi:hypothetical protein
MRPHTGGIGLDRLCNAFQKAAVGSLTAAQRIKPFAHKALSKARIFFVAHGLCAGSSRNESMKVCCPIEFTAKKFVARAALRCKVRLDFVI